MRDEVGKHLTKPQQRILETLRGDPNGFIHLGFGAYRLHAFGRTQCVVQERTLSALLPFLEKFTRSVLKNGRLTSKFRHFPWDTLRTSALEQIDKCIAEGDAATPENPESPLYPFADNKE